MKGVQANNFGGPEVLQYKTDLPVPTPSGGEILVKNEFIGVNYVDVLVLLCFLSVFSSFLYKEEIQILGPCFYELNSLIPDIGASA